QFFAALGQPDPFPGPPAPAAPAAAVPHNTRGVVLRGKAGQPVRHSFTTRVRLKQGRVYSAAAGTDRPWLRAGVTRVAANGEQVTVALWVQAVPGRPGDVLEAGVDVTLNGSQRFSVPVTLVVLPWQSDGAAF